MLKDGPVRTIEDMKGRIGAVNVIGSAGDIGLRVNLAKRGLEPKRDYTIIETGFPNMKAVLFDRNADLIGAVPPFAFDLQLEEKARPLFR